MELERPLAQYSVKLVRRDVIAIVDVDGSGITITNDAERVVAELAHLYGLRDRRVIYRDTLGKWDELLHREGVFVGFALLHGETLEDALRQLAADA
jgi:hypothetical protein